MTAAVITAERARDGGWHPACRLHEPGPLALPCADSSGSARRVMKKHIDREHPGVTFTIISKPAPCADGTRFTYTGKEQQEQQERLAGKRMTAELERQERLEIKRMLTDGVLSYYDIVDAAPLSADDAKVARRQEQLAEQLRKDIASAGEAGWRSPFCTGSSAALPAGWSGLARQYQQWCTAREDWTRTGDRQYLEKMLAAVDFDCPPEAPAVRRSARQHWRPGRNLLITMTVIWLIFIIVMVLL